VYIRQESCRHTRTRHTARMVPRRLFGLSTVTAEQTDEGLCLPAHIMIAARERCKVHCDAFHIVSN